MCLSFLGGLSVFAARLAAGKLFESLIKDGFSSKAQMESRVKQSFQKAGIQSGVDPVVELKEQGGGRWSGTATFGQIVYDISVRSEGSDYIIERRMRSPSTWLAGSNLTI
jgi:hypothetical protein